MRLVQQAETIRKTNGITKELSGEQWAEIRAFNATILFVLALRELHKCIRIGSQHVGIDDADNERRTESYEASSLVPLFIDLSFIYIRRIADLFARASRYVLFKDVGEAPTKYKKLRCFIADDNKLSKPSPICNTKLLQGAFACHSGWIDKLRDSKDDSGLTQKGVRDIMEHFATTVSTAHIKHGDGPWQIVADLGHREMAPSYRPALIQTLKEIVLEIANFWTDICAAAELQKAEIPWAAPFGDVLMLSGKVEDIIGFWPEK